MKKGIVPIAIICLITMTGFMGFISFDVDVVSGVTLYVGGIGPGNYSTIQDAINSSSDGDTVFVHEGRYYENITINRSINLIGENVSNTTIDGMNIRNVILITADWVNVTGFNITNSGSSWSLQDAGIKLYKVTNVTVRGNNCTGNLISLVLHSSSNNLIDSNICNSNTQQGIQLRTNSNDNVITDNECKSSKAGIVLYNSCSGNTIVFNNASSNSPYHGINLDTGCDDNVISNNNVYYNTDEGIYLFNNNDNNVIRNNVIVSNGDHGVILSSGSDNNHVYHNNFIGNWNQAYNGGSGNTWDDGYPSGGNYWSDFDSPGEGAYDDYQGPNQDINGSDGFVDQGTGGGGGKKPYNVPGGSQDEYPFIEIVNVTPTAPRNLQATSGDEYVNLTWDVPLDHGSFRITLYNIYRNDTPGILITVPASQLWYNDTEVVNGITYVYNVSAVNSVGEGPNSTGVHATPLALPSAPDNFQVVFGDTFVNLTWDEPLDVGGSPIVLYHIHRKDIPGIIISVPASQLWYNDTFVKNGEVYTYNISAENSVGEGPCSFDISTSPMTTPSAPYNLQAAAGDGYVRLTWDRPMDEGGTPITGYNLYREGESGVYASVSATRLWYNDTDVTHGESYTYHVSAMNIMGEGPPSNEVSARPVTTPSAPENLQGSFGNGYVYISWEIPSSNGGSKITHYIVYRTGATDIFASVPASQLWYNDTGVKNGDTYNYRVRAVNIAGEGADSDDFTATPMTTPSAPQNFQETAGDGYVFLSWDIPFDDGGSPVTGYNIYRNDTTEVYGTVSGSYLRYNDTHVSNGLTYTYYITAENSAGEGALSVGVTATPMTVPSAPGNMRGTAGNGYVNLTWDAPASDGGSPVSGYIVYRSDWGGYCVWIPADKPWYNDTSVICGTTYTYTVSALNTVGEGPSSNPVDAMPVTVPRAPLNLRATVGDGIITLTWDPPAFHGGSPVTNYRIYRSTTSGNETVTIGVGNTYSYEDTNVRAGTTYIYSVAAENPQGEGPQSNEAYAQLPEEKKEELPWWFWLLLAIIIILAVLLLIVLFKSRKKEEPKPLEEDLLFQEQESSLEPEPFLEQQPFEEETFQPDMSPEKPDRPPPPRPPRAVE